MHNFQSKKFPTSIESDYNFRKCNFSILYDTLLLVDWSFLYSHTKVDDAISSFYQVLDEIFQAYVPKKKNVSGNYPVWFNGNVIRASKQKISAWKRYNKTKSPYDYSTFKTLRTQVKYKI